MMKEKEFKFQIRMPLRRIDKDENQQYFTIYAAYPTIAYSIVLRPDKMMADEDQKRLAISELKVRLIQDISNAQFEEVKEI